MQDYIFEIRTMLDKVKLFDVIHNVSAVSNKDMQGVKVPFRLHNGLKGSLTIYIHDEDDTQFCPHWNIPAGVIHVGLDDAIRNLRNVRHSCENSSYDEIYEGDFDELPKAFDTISELENSIQNDIKLLTHAIYCQSVWKIIDDRRKSE